MKKHNARTKPHQFTAHTTQPWHRRSLLQLAAESLFGSVGAGLAGCGGGAGTDADPAPATPAGDERKMPLGGVDGGGTGIEASYFSAAITSALPLVVAGVQFDTRRCLIADADGNLLAASDLRPGMSSRIKAAPRRYSPGSTLPVVAASVMVGEQVLAPVQSVDVASRSFVALGQQVVLSSSTVFDAALGAGVAAIQPGMLVRVWGDLDLGRDRITATRAELLGSSARWLLRGAVTQLDRAAGTLQIGALHAAFDPTDAGVVGADVALGTVVRAVLSGAARKRSFVLLSARDDSLRLPANVQVEIEGRITRFDTAQSFAVDGVNVALQAGALVTGAAWLGLGARAHVHGRTELGLLLASQLEVEADEPVEFEGTISTADNVNRSFVLNGTTVDWSDTTVFIGGGPGLLGPLRRAAVVGRWNADRSHLKASQIHVEA